MLTGAEPAGWLRDAEQQDVVSFQDADIHHRTAKELPGSSVKVTPVLACQGPVTGRMHGNEIIAYRGWGEKGQDLAEVA